MKKTLLAIVCSLPMLALADSGTTVVAGSAFVNSTCTVTATNLNFGSVQSAPSGELHSTSMVSSTCTKETSYTMSFNTGSQSDYHNRAMTGSKSGNTDLLAYNIYQDTAHANILGDGTNSTYLVSLMGDGTPQNLTVYGSIPLNQYITPDDYTDNLTVTLSY